MSEEVLIRNRKKILFCCLFKTVCFSVYGLDCDSLEKLTNDDDFNECVVSGNSNVSILCYFLHIELQGFEQKYEPLFQGLTNDLRGKNQIVTIYASEFVVINRDRWMIGAGGGGNYEVYF